jgi:multiple sugar transport system substrate-binding protein
MSDVEMPDDVEASRPSGLTRAELVRRGAAGAFAVSMFGGLADRAFGFYGPLRFKNRHLKGDLKIMQWAHFVPDYDKWLDGTYIKQWGEKNDVQVKIDHINNALLPATAASEVAAQSGHDLFQFLFPPSALEKQTIPLNDIVQEVTKKLGKMTDVAYKSTYNPKTKRYFGFADNYVPDPIHYRRSFWFNVGIAPNTWDNVRKAAKKLKDSGHPVGLGMATNDLDSNMFLMSLLYCYGAALQNEHNQPTINTKATIDALKVMKEIYQQGESDEVFAWTASSNNQAFLAGRLSLAVNAISIARSAEDSGNTALSDDTWIAPIPRGPVRRLGNEHVMGVFFIWKFAQNKEAAKKYIVDQQLNYRDHFAQSKFYNFPAWNGAIRGGFKTIHKLAAGDKHKPLGKYTVLTTIAEKYTTNVGYPGFANAAVGDIFNQSLIPQMFAQVAQGKMSPEDGARSMQGQFRTIYARWRAQGLL